MQPKPCLQICLTLMDSYVTVDMTIVSYKGSDAMKTIKASEFKATCLGIMNQIADSGEPVVITKNGKPISKLVPYHHKPESLFGLQRGIIQSHDDLIAPCDETWDADR